MKWASAPVERAPCLKASWLATRRGPEGPLFHFHFYGPTSTPRQSNKTSSPNISRYNDYYFSLGPKWFDVRLPSVNGPPSEVARFVEHS
jgi:hypothetical protein